MTFKRFKLYTYVFYSILLFLTTLSAYLYEKSQKKYLKLFFYFFAFLIPFVVIAFRYEIGTDYQSYINIFTSISHGASSYVEPFYRIINLVVARLGLDVQYVFAIMGFIFLYFSYKSFPLHGFALSVFLFLSIYFFEGGFNQIRQGVAVAIMVYAIKYIYKKEFWHYVFFSILAMSFHYSTGLVLFLMYFFSFITINKYIAILLITVSFSLSIMHIFGHVVLEPIVNILVPSKAWYLSSAYYARTAQSSLGILTSIIYVLIAVTIFLFRDKIVEKYPEASIPIHFALFYFVFYFAHIDIKIFSRVQNMFVMYYILSLVYMVKYFKRNNRLNALLFVSAMAVTLYYHYINIGDSRIPHSTQMRPYKTILFDKDQ